MLEIKVLGSGCPNCLKLENMCREIVDETPMMRCLTTNKMKISGGAESESRNMYVTN